MRNVSFERMEKQANARSEYLQVIYLIENSYPGFIRTPPNSLMKRQTTQFKKVGRSFEKRLHQRRYTYNNSTHEKTLSIISHYENASLNHILIVLHPCG